MKSVMQKQIMRLVEQLAMDKCPPKKKRMQIVERLKRHVAASDAQMDEFRQRSIRLQEEKDNGGFSSSSTDESELIRNASSLNRMATVLKLMAFHSDILDRKVDRDVRDSFEVIRDYVEDLSVGSLSDVSSRDKKFGRSVLKLMRCVGTPPSNPDLTHLERQNGTIQAQLNAMHQQQLESDKKQKRQLSIMREQIAQLTEEKSGLETWVNRLQQKTQSLEADVHRIRIERDASRLVERDYEKTVTINTVTKVREKTKARKYEYKVRPSKKRKYESTGVEVPLTRWTNNEAKRANQWLNNPKNKRKIERLDRFFHEDKLPHYKHLRVLAAGWLPYYALAGYIGKNLHEISESGWGITTAVLFDKRESGPNWVQQDLFPMD